MNLLKYALKRLVIMLFTLFLIATSTFFLLAATPGDALSARVEKLPDTVTARLYAKYGLDKPVMERYVITMKGLLVGDFGESIIYQGETVQSIIKAKGPVSARLGIQQMLLGVTIGLLLGILAAVKKGSFWDYLVVSLSILLISVPSLVFSLGLQQLFAGKLGWFPVIGWPSAGSGFWSGWEYTVLPTLAGCFSYIASYARLLKASMLDVMNQDYILTAESKGLTHREVIFHHVLRNSFIPIITNLPMSVAMCITGSFYIESVFSIPGLGLYYVNAVAAQDVTIVMGETVIISALYIAVIFITDILYTVVDPRIRISGGKR
jgi:oligopeptide transport system permease protein